MMSKLDVCKMYEILALLNSYPLYIDFHYLMAHHGYAADVC